MAVRAKNAEIRTITGNLSGNATSATTATNDTKGQAITSYIRALSISGRTITYTKGDGTTGTITTQDTNTTYTLAGLVGSTAIGSTTQPIYWDGSKFTTIGYTIAKSVPSNAIFTDQNVTQVLSETSDYRPLLMGETHLTTTDGLGATITSQVRVNPKIYAQTGTGTIFATKFKGALEGNASTATTATKLGTSTVGGTAKPIYLNAGTATALSATVGSTDIPVYLNAGTITASTKKFSDYLPLAGGTMNSGTYITFSTDSRTLMINHSGITFNCSSSSGGWATGFDWKKSDDTMLTSFGVYGITDSLQYLYFGGSWDDPYLKILPDRSVVATKFSGALSGNATTATTASKLGTSTVGGTAKPIYLNAGTATTLSATVGGTTQPVYLNAGTITASNASVGNSATPVYMENGIIKSTGKSFSSYVLKRENGYSYNHLASYYPGGNTPTIIRIYIPKQSSAWTMCVLEMTLKENHGNATFGKIIFHGNWSSSAEWNNLYAETFGRLTDITMYASDKQYIYIKGSFSWPTLTVDKMLIGDHATNYDLSGITIDNVTALPTTYQTVTMQHGVLSSDVSTSATANTIVRRDSNNYVQFGYINSSTSNNENPTISQIIVTNGSDNFYRKASLAHLKTALGSMPPSAHVHTGDTLCPVRIEFSTGSSAGYGGYIDFHFNGSTADYTSRIIESASGTISINGVTVNGSTITGSLSGNATSATTASTCSGNAASASTLLNPSRLTTTAAVDAFIEANRFKYATVAAINGFTGTYNNNDGMILSASWESTSYGHQIYLDDSGYGIHHRFRNNGSWANWVQLIDSSNYKTYCTPANIGAATTAVATTSANGLMSAADKKKLDGIASGANAYTHPSHTAYSSGLYKVTVNALGHVTAATAVTKADITALGIPGSDTNTWRGVQDNLTSTATDQSLSANQGRVLKGLVDGKAAASHTHSYLPLAGGTMASDAQIIRAGYSTSWIGGRSRALIRLNTISGYSPAISIKTTNGSWDIGAYDNPSYADKLVFSYCTDANFNVDNNSTTAQIMFNSDGSISGKISWDSVTGKPSSFTPASHSHDYLPLAGGTMSGSIITPKNDNMGIIPDTNNYGQIGSSDKKFFRMYATTFYGNLSGTATNATQDSAGQQINTTYIKALSVSGTTITYTKGDGTTGTITTQDTNTWRGIQNNLTSDSTTDSLSAAQGKVLKGLVDGKADASHTHSYLPLSGGTMSGNLTMGDTKTIILRTHESYRAGIGYDTSGNECIALWAKNTVTRLRWYAGKDMSTVTAGTMMGITPDFEVSKASGSVVGYLAGNTIIHSGNYTSYTVKKDGTGASGTWGINVTGSAGSVAWGNVTGKPSTYTPASHTHNYAGSSSAGGDATNALKLGGLSASASATKSTIVARDSNNYVFFNYINSNTSNSENPTISQIIVTNGSDSYYRKASLAHLKSSLGSMPASDVYAWAKASTKPSYTASEVGAAAASHTHSGYVATSGGAMTGALKVNCSNVGTDYTTYRFRNIGFGTTSTPTSDSTYGGSGAIYFMYS